MKKILSAMLVVCLMLTITASALPASVNGSTNLSQSEMQAVTGGTANGWCVLGWTLVGFTVGGLFGGILFMAAATDAFCPGAPNYPF
jgi:hypothetical protein